MCGRVSRHVLEREGLGLAFEAIEKRYLAGEMLVDEESRARSYPLHLKQGLAAHPVSKIGDEHIRAASLIAIRCGRVMRGDDDVGQIPQRRILGQRFL